MNELRRKLERLANLRPISSSPAGQGPTQARDLARVLDGRIVRTNGGEHFRLSTVEPLPFEPFAESALAILARDPQVAKMPPSRWLLLDTETTGLAGGTGTYAFLVGVAQWRDDHLIVDQYFMRGYGEERSLLEAVAERLAAAELLITFNGKVFDLPLLETRFRLARLHPPIYHLAHLDLLYAARQLWRTRLGTVRLTELERAVLGRERDGDIPGKLIPQIYFDFLRRGDPLPLGDVFRHNRYDLCALAVLLARLLQAVAAPEKFSPAEPLDLFGLSRLLESRGLLEPSRTLYARALDLGLPEEHEPMAVRRLAALAKRLRDYPRATTLWQTWSERDAMAVRPDIELAIFHEHFNRNYDAALAATRRAITKLQRAAAVAAISHDSLLRQRRELEHRQARLERKQARQFGSTAASNR